MRLRPAATTLALLALIAGLAAAAAAPSRAAAAGKPCWEQVIDDWLDNGTIDKQYKAVCYQQALKHVPEDLRDYSNITDAISAALSATLRGASGNGNPGGGGDAGPGSDQPVGNKSRPPQAVPAQSIYDKGIHSLGT